MKTLTLAFLLGGIATLASAQSNVTDKQAAVATTGVTTAHAPLPEPEWIQQICLLSDDGSLVPLEAQKPTVATKMKALGLGSGTTAFEYKGVSSPTRTTNPVFVVKIEGSDPSTLVILNEMKVDKGKGVRQIVIEKVGSMLGPGGYKSSVDPNAGMDFRFVRYGTVSAKIVPAVPLPPGEYAFRTRAGITYLFGVDPK